MTERALTVATWNINSVRLRIGLVERLLKERGPDVLALQETKSPDDAFPKDAFEAAGYPHLLFRGEKNYNGVAIASRWPLTQIETIDFCGKGDARHLAAEVTVESAPPIAIHAVYVPAGGDTPDPETNAKFDHKLRFVSELTERFAHKPGRSVLMGDLNIAPLAADVWSHKQLLKVVSHTPMETEGLIKAQEAGGWTDACRAMTPEPERLYSWWSYRARDWSASDRGRRLDHIWLSRDLAPTLAHAEILRDARGWEKPSDHVPVLATFALGG